MRILAGDIGGTKTRLAVFEVGKERWPIVLAEQSYDSVRYDSLDILVSRFLDGFDGACRIASFGIAGPIKSGRCETTNLPWTVDAHRLALEQGFERVYLINDLEANAWGIAALKEKDFFVLNPGDPQAQGNAAVIAAGTGLGEAGMYWDGSQHRPFATEGGHTDFSPGDALETALLEYLAKRFQHVSWERVLSGPGLVNVYQFLTEHHRVEGPAGLQEELHNNDVAAAISTAGLAGRCPLCSQALDLFAHLYGVEAGNLALKVMATGGVYIGGGIAPKILERIKGPNFMSAFIAKGRMQPLLEGMPVKVILNDRTALLGPALCAACRVLK
ncbi:MAG: glucokinase [Gammaproteobacteria bacterium]|nr:glucokinase [Gammaproteobacteria bacterium]